MSTSASPEDACVRPDRAGAGAGASLSTSTPQTRSLPVGSGPLTLTGGSGVALVELYTSEGCNSCPPADKWLSALKSHPRLFLDFAPVSFHVHYWDHLGWTDKWGTAEFSARQQALAKSGALSGTYTPCVTSGGQELRGWMRTKPPGLPSPTDGYSLDATVDAGRSAVTAVFGPAPAGSSLVLNVAITASDITSKVARGENKGRTLHHDFVVLTKTHQRMTPSTDSSRGPSLEATIPLPKAPAVSETGRLAIAIWVSRSPDGAATAAAGAWLSSQ